MQRFVFYDCSALIKDYMFYATSVDEIDQWLEENNSHRQGMVIQFADEKVKTMFMLKWSV